MRYLALLVYGVFLLALDGALCRVFHLEWIHPDPILLLDVFIALHLTFTEGAVLVFLSGIAADSFAGTPTGMLLTAHMLAWLLVRWARQFVVPDQPLVQRFLVFVLSILFNLFLVLQLATMDTGNGPIWISLKSMVPLALLHVLLARLVWMPARKMFPPASHRRFQSVF